MPWSCSDCGTENNWPKQIPSNEEAGLNDVSVKCSECEATFWVVRTNTDYDIPAHWKHFSTFFKMMLEEMDGTFLEKGNSWLDAEGIIVKKNYGDREIPMDRHLTLELEKIFHRFMERGEIEYLKHLGNFCAMLRLRKLLKEENGPQEE